MKQKEKIEALEKSNVENITRLNTIEKREQDRADNEAAEKAENARMFVQASQSQAILSNMIQNNEVVLQRVTNMNKHYEEMKEIMARAQKANSLMIFGVPEVSSPETDGRKVIRESFAWVIPEYTRFSRRGRSDHGKIRPIVVMFNSPNQVLSCLSASNAWARRTYKTSRTPFYMTKDKTPQQLTIERETGKVIKELRELRLGDWRNRDGNICEFRDDLFVRMISEEEAVKLITDAHNRYEREREEPRPPPPPANDPMDTTGTA